MGGASGDPGPQKVEDVEPGKVPIYVNIIIKTKRKRGQVMDEQILEGVGID